ncbi:MULTISPECIES: hypothetical protein [unclassified Streptomyces]|uniref:hypothetical protein n=1 Tax=unclassified Streptomyces TaxID=2593676 RepID=UPI002237E733|nr:hypothetical protein [Streptomyces sp. SHP 1-2]MCW5250334.1 hypothetical protein [Streptomyces sp. SHP 1-2]
MDTVITPRTGTRATCTTSSPSSTESAVVSPADLTGLALLLASDASGWMTGGTYVADGGASALTQVLSDTLPGPEEE